MKPIQSNTKKTLVRTSLTALFLAFGGLTATAQTKMGKGLIGGAELKPDFQNAIVSFSPVYNNGKTFVRWLVSNDEKDGIFIVERSTDGTEFEALGFKDRVGSSLCVNLFYSFIDEAPVTGQSYYRVMSVGTDQTFTYSDVVRVRTDVQSSSPSNNSVSNETEGQ
jgi:hypothetical protein